MRCYFYIQKQLSNETQTVMLSEEGRGGGGVRKKKGGKGDKERSEQRREEGDYLHKKKKFLSEILLSHWKSKAADRALFSPSVSFLTHKRRTKTHSLCPHPAATVTTKHTLTHSTQPEREKEQWGQKDRMRHIVNSAAIPWCRPCFRHTDS